MGEVRRTAQPARQPLDTALRAHFLSCLDRDLKFAERGILGELIMPTKWEQVKHYWRGEGHPGTRIINMGPLRPSGFGAPPSGGFGMSPSLQDEAVRMQLENRRP